MTGNRVSLGSGAHKALVVAIALMTVSVMFAGGAAATVTSITASTPQDISGGSADAAQQIADESATAGSLDFSLDSGGNNPSSVTVKIDVSDLVDAGANLSNAEITDGDGNSGFAVSGGGSASAGFSNVDTAAQEIQLVVTSVDDGSTVNIDELYLSGIDTSGVDGANNLEYVVRADDENGGDFGSSFSTDTIATTSQFSIADIQNVDQGTSYTTISGALSEVNAGDTIEVGSGTYEEQFAITTEDVSLVATGSAEDTVITHDATDAQETVSVQAGGVTVDGFTIERTGDTSSGAVQAIAVRDTKNSDNPVTISNNIIDLTGDGSGQALGVYVRDGTSGSPVGSTGLSDADVSNVVIENNEVGNIDAGFGVGVGIATDDSSSDNTVSDITVQNNNVSANDNGVWLANIGGGSDDSTTDNIQNVEVSNNDLENNVNSVHFDEDDSSAEVDPAEVTISGNYFNSSEVHVLEGIDASDIDTGTIFDNNEFEQSITVSDESNNELVGDIVGTQLDKVSIPTSANDYVIDVSAGEFDTGSTLTIGDGPSSVAISGASNADSNVTVNSANPVVQLDTGSGSVTEVEVSNLNFNEVAGNVILSETGNSNDIDGVTIADNEINGIDSTQTVVDLTNANRLEGTVAVDNNVVTTADGSPTPGYTFVDLGTDSIATDADDATVSVSGNSIDGISGTAVTAQIDDSSGAGTATVDVSNNDVANITSGTAVSLVDVASVEELTISGNTIAATSDDGGATGVAVSYTNQGDSVSVTDNELVGLGTAGLDLGDSNGETTATVTDNTFDSNAKHIDFTDADEGGVSEDFDPATLVSDNNYATLVYQSTSSENPTDNLANTVLHGTVSQATSTNNGNFVLVEPGVYEETGITPQDTAEQDIISTGSAAETILRTTDNTQIINVDQGVTVDGFTFEATEDSGTTVTVSSSSASLTNSTFAGDAFEDRTAISVAAGADISNVTISEYGTGISVTAAATVSDSTVVNSGTGLSINYGGTATVVRNTISDNTVGIAVADVGSTAHKINFNDIVNNADAGVELSSSDDIDQLLANYWGDENGPDISTDVGADIVESSDGDADSIELRPWLTSSYTELPQDRMVVVPDASAPPADATGSEGAHLLVAVLDDDLSADSDDTTFIVDGPDDLVEEDDSESIGTDKAGSVSAADPLLVPSTGTPTFDSSIVPADDTPGDYTITAVNTADDVDSGSATQTFSGAVADVNVTTDTTDLTADGDTTANVTLQLVDSEGNPVPRETTGDQISWSIDNKAAAGVERVSTDTDADADGQATLTVTADTAGETFTVTGIDNSNNNADNVDINAVAPTSANFTVDLVSGPTEIVQNESFTAEVSVTNTGDGAGTQTIEYDLEDSTGISQLSASQEVTLEPGASQTVTFEVAASDTDALSTGDYTHVVASDDDEATLAATVVEAQQQPDAPDVNGNGNAATDTDGDGQFEDINGDGASDILDVQVLFSNLNSDAVQNNTELFDFNGDGEVSILDVQALFSQQSESGSGDR